MDIYRLIDAKNRHPAKKIWSVNDVATIYPGESRATLARFMRRSAAKGLLKSLIARGRSTARYFSDNPPDVYEAALYLDPGAVVSGLSALSRHGVTTQVSHAAVCVTRSRRGGRVQRRIRTTVGDVEFHYQPDRMMDLEPEGSYPETRLASPEKALLDHIYICRFRYRDLAPDLTELDFDLLDATLLARYRVVYPKAVWKVIEKAEALGGADPSSFHTTRLTITPGSDGVSSPP